MGYWLKDQISQISQTIWKTYFHFTKLSNRRKDSTISLGKRFLIHFSLDTVENIPRTSLWFKWLFLLHFKPAHLFLKALIGLLYFHLKFSLSFSLFLCPSGKFHLFLLLFRIGGHSRFERYKSLTLLRSDVRAERWEQNIAAKIFSFSFINREEDRKIGAHRKAWSCMKLQRKARVIHDADRYHLQINAFLLKVISHIDHLV